MSNPFDSYYFLKEHGFVDALAPIVELCRRTLKTRDGKNNSTWTLQWFPILDANDRYEIRRNGRLLFSGESLKEACDRFLVEVDCVKQHEEWERDVYEPWNKLREEAIALAGAESRKILDEFLHNNQEPVFNLEKK